MNRPDIELFHRAAVIFTWVTLAALALLTAAVIVAGESWVVPVVAVVFFLSLFTGAFWGAAGALDAEREWRGDRGRL